MSACNEIVTGAAKLRYASPALTVYGSVRDLTGSTSAGTMTDAGNMMTSDPAYKENVVQVGTHPQGFGLYLFDYKAEYRDAMGHGRKFGVMADEVEAVMPQAVVLNADGYRSVDYAMIGITLH